MDIIHPKLLYSLCRHLPCHKIEVDGRPYIERFFLFNIFGIEVVIHRILSPDPEGRTVHNHPWMWAKSLIMWGKYNEDRIDGLTNYQDLTPIEAKFILRRHSVSQTVDRFNFLHAGTFHRIYYIDYEEVWTLFWHPKWSRVWGFLTEAGFERASEDRIDKDKRPMEQWWKTAKKGKEIMEKERKTSK